MSCLNLTRLLPRTKLWKLFKTKLPLKIHKLTSSKAIKKHIQQQRQRSNSHKSHKKLSWSSLSIQPKRFKKKVHNNNNYKGRIYFNKKLPPPIYVDELFIEPSEVIKSTQKSLERETEAKVFKPSSSSNCGSSKRSANRDKNTTMMISPDDMWESLAMTSPQMDGIDERAEEFIARFRAEMQSQETLIARRL